MKAPSLRPWSIPPCSSPRPRSGARSATKHPRASPPPARERSAARARLGDGGAGGNSGSTDRGLGPGTAGKRSGTGTTRYQRLRPHRHHAVQARPHLGHPRAHPGRRLRLHRRHRPGHAMTDLAVEGAGDIWALSPHNVYQLTLPGRDRHGALREHDLRSQRHAACQVRGAHLRARGRHRAPAEVLVAGNTAGELWAIDTSGALTQHGTFGTVPANDGHGHTTLRTRASRGSCRATSSSSPTTAAPSASPPCATARTPRQHGLQHRRHAHRDRHDRVQGRDQSVHQAVRGQVVKAPAAATPQLGLRQHVRHRRLRGNVYGFSHQGSIVTIDNNDGTACLALSTPNDEWAGAAITTFAPVMVPTAN